MRHANLSIFVPHVGCPNQCCFCNQRSISGAAELPTGESVRRLCERGERELAGRGAPAEIAFFGGSFTAIDRAYMRELLEAAAPFARGGVFRGIRVSTRPDCIDREVLELLRGYGVTAIELGAQSMDDAVLEESLRGHTAARVEDAARLIARAGFELGLQMMTGLPGSDAGIDRETARRLARLRPRTVRVYPTLVLEGTGLAARLREKTYRPQTLEEAVSLGAWILDFFETRRGIPVIRLGLHAEESLERGLLAGPYHPALRELCEGELLYNRISARISQKGDYRLAVSPKSVSKLTGHGARPIEKLRRMGYNITIQQDQTLQGLDFKIGEV